MLDLRARSGDEAVRTLHRRLSAGTDAVGDPPRFLAGLLDRLHLAPVCIAEDIALPHARTDAVNRLVLAIGRAREGIAFGVRHPHVRLVFLMGTPKDAVTEYLQAAAQIARFLRQGLTRAALLAAGDEVEFRTALAGGVAAAR